jgi:hypothetical protein
MVSWKESLRIDGPQSFFELAKNVAGLYI